MELDALYKVIEGSSAIYVLFAASLPRSFKMKGYASSSGRLDVVARSMANVAAIEPSASVLVVFSDYSTVLLARPGLPSLSEVEIMNDVLTVISRGSGEYFSIFRTSFEELIDRMSLSHSLVLLKEGGGTEDLSGRKAFFLGSNVDMSADAEEIIMRRGGVSASIGPLSLHADHVVAFVAWMRSSKLNSST